MDRDSMHEEVKRYAKLRDDAARRAVNNIMEKSYDAALVAVADAMRYEACIEEYKFQIEAMEVM